MHHIASPSQLALDALRRLVHALRRASHGPAGALSGAQQFVLRELQRAPAATIADLAARTHTDPSSVSVVVARLCVLGLCTRKRSRVDRRRVGLELTAKGRARARRGPEPVQERLVQAIAALPAKDRRHLARLLDDLATTVGVPATAPMFFEEAGR